MDSPQEYVGIAGRGSKDFDAVAEVSIIENCIRCGDRPDALLAFAANLFPFCNPCLALLGMKIEEYLDK